VFWLQFFLGRGIFAEFAWGQSDKLGASPEVIEAA
jgi:hypothetical protein